MAVRSWERWTCRFGSSPRGRRQIKGRKRRRDGCWVRGAVRGTKNQVNDVVDNLRVGADLSDAPLECFCVAHDAQQMNALQHNRAVAVSRSINVGWGPAEQISRNMTVMIGNVMATAADRSITAQIRPKWDNNERSFNIRWDVSWHELDTNLRDEFQDQERVHQCRMGKRRRQSSW